MTACSFATSEDVQGRHGERGFQEHSLRELCSHSGDSDRSTLIEQVSLNIELSLRLLLMIRTFRFLSVRRPRQNRDHDSL